jgi:hypothetical protein
MNQFSMRFINGANFGGLSVWLPVYGGPDPPLRNSMNSALGTSPITSVSQSGQITWNNATTVSGRTHPPAPPSEHQTEGWSIGLDKGVPAWGVEFTAQPFATTCPNFFLGGGFPIGDDIGDRFLIGIRHIVNTFSVTTRSQFCFIDENATGSAPNFRQFLFA